MADRKRFTDRLFELLKNYKYVLFNYDLLFNRKEKEDLALEFLLDQKEVTPLLNQLKQEDHDVQHIKLSSSFRFSKAVIKFKDQSSLRILFIHKLMHKTLTYMDASVVLEKRALTSGGFYIPSLEHQFEDSVLHAYLNNTGLKEKHYLYFNDFHVLIQEDLLEFFNTKYGTSFPSLFSLTDFYSVEKVQMVEQLKTFPFNRFMKKMNVRWHNFVGVMRQARMI
ncbi:MAG: hypothetical protein AB8F74_08530 [Saprospiraceae bacterium]